MGAHGRPSNQSWWVYWTACPFPCSRPVLPLLLINPNLSSLSPVGLCCINHFPPFSLSIGSFPSTYKHAQISPTWKKNEKLLVDPKFPSSYSSLLPLSWQLPKRKIMVTFFIPSPFIHSRVHCSFVSAMTFFCNFHEKVSILTNSIFILQNFSAGLATARHQFLINTSHPFFFSPD